MQQRPLNRAERRRARRTTAVAGAGLALTSSLAGFYPGSSRIARAYVSAMAATDTANCNVSTWAELKAALESFQTHTPASDNSSLLACSTVTFTSDISDLGINNPIDAQLPPIEVPSGRSLTIDGDGKTLSFDGLYGTGLSVSPENGSATAPSWTVKDLEIVDSPSGYAGAQLSSTFFNSGFNFTLQDSWLHGSSLGAIKIQSGGGAVNVAIEGSEISDVSGKEVVSVTGGGFYGAEVAVSVSDSYFHGNDSFQGALFVYGSLSVVDSTFSYNSSTYGAGAISVRNVSQIKGVSVSNSTFFENESSSHGSLFVYVPYSPLEGAPAGGLLQPFVGPSAGELQIDHSTFFNSTGGLYPDHPADEVYFDSNNNESVVSLTNSVFWGSGAYSDFALVKDAGTASTWSISNSAFRSGYTSDSYTYSGNVDSGVGPTNMTFGDHGGSVLPSFQFGPPAALVDPPPHIPTILPGEGSPLIDAAGTGGPALDQRDVTRPQGDAADIGSVEVEAGSDVTVTVTPVTPQSITYGNSPNLTPTYSGFTGTDDWDVEPLCKVYDASDNEVTTTPIPVGTYTIKCAGGTLPAGYVADYTATAALTVTKAAATLTYTGTQGVATGSSITLSGTVSPSQCSSTGIIYKVNGTTAPAGSYSVTAGQIYEIEMSYSDPNCEASAVFAIVLAGSAADASNGGGYYNVSGAGKINFGYTVQVNKSRNGSTQVSGQILWNSQNGKFRFKGVITGFVKTTTGCAPGTICGRIIGTGTLRTRNELGEWVVVGTGMAFTASVIDAGSASVCTGGRKSTCTTVNKPDSFGIDIQGATLVGEQPLSGVWPTPVQLSGGNIVIK